MTKKVFFGLLSIILLISACTSKPTPYSAITLSPSLTKTDAATVIPSVTQTIKPTQTPTLSPTPTSIPEVDLTTFIFPYNVGQTTSLWKQLNIPYKYQYFDNIL